MSQALVDGTATRAIPTPRADALTTTISLDYNVPSFASQKQPPSKSVSPTGHPSEPCHLSDTVGSCFVKPTNTPPAGLITCTLKAHNLHSFTFARLITYDDQHSKPHNLRSMATRSPYASVEGSNDILRHLRVLSLGSRLRGEDLLLDHLRLVVGQHCEAPITTPSPPPSVLCQGHVCVRNPPVPKAPPTPCKIQSAVRDRRKESRRPIPCVCTSRHHG